MKAHISHTLDIINIEQDDAHRNVGSNQEGDESQSWQGYDGPTDSHFVRYTAKEFQGGQAIHRGDWRTNARIEQGGATSFSIQSRRDDQPYEPKLSNDAADASLTPGQQAEI